MPRNADDDIIKFEEGYAKVNTTGIKPFLTLIEDEKREFFKAKEFVELYDLIFKMCIQRDPYNHSEPMYEKYKESIKTYLLEKVIVAFDKVKNSHETAFLKEWTIRWKKQTLVVKGMSKLFMYLDRFYTVNTDNVEKLSEQGYKLYKDIVFETYREFAENAILKCIEKERNAEEQDRHLLQEAVNVFVQLGYNYADKKLQVYRQYLETPICAHALQHYQRMARIWLDQDSCPNYLEKADRMLQQEKFRVDSYLHHSTLEPLTRDCYKALLQDHQLELLSKKTGVHQMLSINAVEDLTRLYKLYSKYPADLDPIAEMVLEHIKMAGSEVVDKAKPTPGQQVDVNHGLVRNLIALHAQYNKVVTDCFEKSQVFQKALKKAFEDFINKDNRVSKLLAKFVDAVLKKGTKLNIKDVDGTLDNVVFIYGYIQEKDVFERDYQYHLSRRLLSGLCESEHSEKSMIAKLKTECGYQWTNKLEGMFKDVVLSKELMTKFKGDFHTGELEIDMDVNICTTGYWPSTKSVPCKLPAELQKACDKFKSFYLQQHGGRKLEWRMDQGQADIQVVFNSNMKRGLTLTTYQMIIMLSFDQSKVITFQQILDATKIPSYEISNHLLSLCHPKVKVLLKRPDHKDLKETDKFMINPKYASRLMNMAVPLLKTVEDPGKQKTEEKHIQLQRRHQMDAAIVRIMKARQTLRHNLLVAEVMGQLQKRFSPKPTDIKKRIEALIEQEYLERDANDRGTYKYLA